MKMSPSPMLTRAMAPVAVAGDHVDDGDVVAVEQHPVVAGDHGRAVPLRCGGGALGIAVADPDDPAPLVPGPAGQVGQARPPSRAHDADAELVSRGHAG